MAIPKGTFLSILTTSVSYALIVIWLGFTVVRDATGSVDDYLNGTFQNCSMITCKYGLMNDYQVSIFKYVLTFNSSTNCEK